MQMCNAWNATNLNYLKLLYECSHCSFQTQCVVLISETQSGHQTHGPSVQAIRVRTQPSVVRGRPATERLGHGTANVKQLRAVITLQELTVAYKVYFPPLTKTENSLPR